MQTMIDRFLDRYADLSSCSSTLFLWLDQK